MPGTNEVYRRAVGGVIETDQEREAKQERLTRIQNEAIAREAWLNNPHTKSFLLSLEVIRGEKLNESYNLVGQCMGELDLRRSLVEGSTINKVIQLAKTGKYNQ